MKKILIIDNEESILEALRFILSDAGYEVETFVELGIEGIKKSSPDLLLLDMRLSRKDGAEIARKLKKDRETKSIPIIFISASPIDVKLIKRYGANDYIQKPFDIDFLLRKVKGHIK